MKTIKLFLSILLFGLYVSCSSHAPNNADNTVAELEEMPESASAISKTGKYQIKSGVVTYKSNVMNMDQTTVITFDDYGNKEVTDTYTEAMGVKLHDRTIVKNGYAYNLNMSEKRGTKVKMLDTGSSIDYTNLTKEMEEKMNLKKIGSENMLGKECDIFSFDYKQMSTSGMAWIWKGVALKSVVNAMGMEVTLNGVSFDDNPSIDQGIFEVPDGFTMIER